MSPGLVQAVSPAARQELLHQKAEELEAAFLSEMLGHAGMDASVDGFGGGVGEEQFASFLRNAEATAMVRAGGIGLAESLFHALAKGEPDEG